MPSFHSGTGGAAAGVSHPPLGRSPHRSGPGARWLGIVLLAFLVLALSAHPSFAQYVLELDRLDPSFAVAGGPDFLLMVRASKQHYYNLPFTEGDVVLWNGADRPTELVDNHNGNILYAEIPSSDIGAAGTVQISVRTPAGITTNALTFEIVAPRT
ncbi:MAG TPA: hypothetical protein VNI57_10810, partial [Candidatus Saccharimonadales bacterium]|nr:hypothetical protein [Candidatus Saccharimonadales bacterium]